TPGIGEDLVKSCAQLEERGLVKDFRAAPVPCAAGHQKRIERVVDTAGLICGIKPGFFKLRFAHGLRLFFTCASYPGADLFHIACCTKLDGFRAIELTENARPEPAVELIPGLLGRQASGNRREARQNDRERDNLCGIRDLFLVEDAALAQELCDFL